MMRLFLALAVACSLLSVSALAAAQDRPFSAGVFDPVQIVPNSQGISGARLHLFYGYNTRLKGFDFALLGVNRLKSDMTGAQVAAFNWTEGGKQVGAQLGIVNWTKGHITGAQGGWAFNYAKEVTGAQVGIVNYTERLNKGIQIGIVNIAKNGFLPVFVLFNFNFD